MAAPKSVSDTKDEELIEDNDDIAYEDNEEFSGDSSSDSDEEADVKLDVPSKDAIFNRDGLNDKLQEISWPDHAGWVHKLSLEINQEQEVDVNDDITRETAFYTQALEGTRRAFEKFETMGLPFLRPPEYNAEIGTNLSKEVQAQKQKERASQKKGEIETVKKSRKQSQESGFAPGENDELDLDLGEVGKKPSEKSNKQRPGVGPVDRLGGKGRKSLKSKPDKKVMKRVRKDSKFGFGGRKGMKKQNTADTTDDGFKGCKKTGAEGNKRRKQ